MNVTSRLYWRSYSEKEIRLRDGARHLSGHTLFPLVSQTHTHTTSNWRNPWSSSVPKSRAKGPFFFYIDVVEINLPLNGAIKIKTQLIQPCPRRWPKHPHRLIPKGMHQDAIYRREHKHFYHTPTRIKLQSVTSPNASSEICDVPHRTNSRPKWKPSCFFLITWKESNTKTLGY